MGSPTGHDSKGSPRSANAITQGWGTGLPPRQPSFNDDWSASGATKPVWSKSLGLSRRRADALTSGRGRPTPAELRRMRDTHTSFLCEFADGQTVYSIYVQTDEPMTVAEFLASPLPGAAREDMASRHGYPLAAPLVRVIPREPAPNDPRFPRLPGRPRIFRGSAR